jgi:hypothetical protein
MSEEKETSVQKSQKQNIQRDELATTPGEFQSNPHDLVVFYLSLARKCAVDFVISISQGAKNIAYERASDLTSDLTNAYSFILSNTPTKDTVVELTISLNLALSLEHTFRPELRLEAILQESRSLIHVLLYDSDSFESALYLLNEALDEKANFSDLEISPKNGLTISRLIAKSIIIIHGLNKVLDRASYCLTLKDDRLLKFNSTYLSRDVLPFINAFTEIQHIIDEINGRSPTNIEILAIRKGSVTVDMTGGIRDTVELVLDLVVPYRRKTKKRQAELDVATKEIEVKQKEADLKKAQATLEADSEQANVDVEKAQAEVALLRQQERELALKNKKQELELFELTLAMVDKIKKGLSDSERLYYATKLLDPTRLIATSPLELISAEPISSADGLGAEPGIQ